MLLYQYACACCQPVIGGLPLQHAQGALLLSCELRRLNRRLRSAGGGASTGVVSTGGFGLRFGAAGSVGTSCLGLFLLPRGPAPPFRFRRRSVWCSVWRSVHLLRLRLLRRRLLFGRLHLIIRGQDITRRTKTTHEAGRRCRPGRSGGSACASG